jgi:hypothetical protein
LENLLPNRALEYCLGNAHWFDAVEPPLEPHIARLTDYVRRLLNKERMASAEQAEANRKFPRPAEGVDKRRRFRGDVLRGQPRLIAAIAAAVLIVVTLVMWLLGRGFSIREAADEGTADHRVAVLPAGRGGEAQIAGGTWRVEGDELVEAPGGKNWSLLMFGDPTWSRYNLTLQAKVVNGNDGFAVRFNVVNPYTFRKFHLGAFENEYYVLNTFIDNRYGEQHRRLHKGSIAKNRWYDVRLEVRGPQCRCMLDGTTWFSLDDERLTQGRIGLSADRTAVRFRDIRVTSEDGKTVLWQGNPRLPSRR